jgi:hypothetical protein
MNIILGGAGVFDEMIDERDEGPPKARSAKPKGLRSRNPRESTKPGAQVRVANLGLLPQAN